MKSPIIQVKVTIDGIKPPIWRRLLLGSTTTFNELHHTLQIAFGWENSHLFQFEVEDYNIGVPDPEDITETIDARGVMVSKILKKVGDEIEYEYDFGDSWYHMAENHAL